MEFWSSNHDKFPHWDPSLWIKMLRPSEPLQGTTHQGMIRRTATNLASFWEAFSLPPSMVAAPGSKGSELQGTTAQRLGPSTLLTLFTADFGASPP